MESGMSMRFPWSVIVVLSTWWWVKNSPESKLSGGSKPTRS
jgi:hypothetical protein